MYQPQQPFFHLEAMGKGGLKAWLAALPFYWHMACKAPRDSLETLHAGEMEGEGRARFFKGLGGGVWRLYRPETLRAAFIGQRAHLIKGRLTQNLMAKTLGKGLLLTEGSAWAVRRKALNSAFSKEALTILTTATQNRAEAFAQALKPGSFSRFQHQLEQFTMHNALAAMFGRIPNLNGLQMGADIAELLADMGSLDLADLLGLPMWVPRMSKRGAAKRLLPRVHKALASLASEVDEETPTFLALLQAYVAPEDMMDEILTFFGAGYETTSVALAWACYTLAQNLEIQAQVRKGDANVCKAFTQEIMRLYPPIAFLTREATADFELVEQGHRLSILTGQVINVPLWVVQRHPALWSQPEKVRLERFLPGGEGLEHQAAYFPFGIGNRMCIGKHFAEATLLVCVQCLLARFRLFPSGPAPEPLGQISLRLKGDLGLRLEAL